MEFGIGNIIGSCEAIENSLSLSNSSDDIRLLSMKILYKKRLDYLLNNIWRLEPCHGSLIEFSSFKNEEESIYLNLSNIGIVDSNEISFEKCLTLRNEKEKIFKGEEFKFEIISYSKEGNGMKKGGNGMKFKIQIEGELNNENGENEENEWEIKDLNNGKYEVKIKLKNEGKYLIFVKYNGFDINSSPFKVQVFPKPRNYNEINQPKLTFGSQGSGYGQFQNPYGITINSEGNILVSEYGNHRIQIFNSEGKFISTFGASGKGNGQVNHPWGIAINSKGNIIAIEHINHRVHMFDSEGKFFSTFGSSGKGNGQFNYPYEVCIDSEDNIYVSEFGNSRIQIFDSEGKFISTLGSNGQLSGPRGITKNSKGNIIVCDSGHNRIQVFSVEGKCIMTFGSSGTGSSQFSGPWATCVDLNDNILVCDYGNNRVQVFNPSGEYITEFKVMKPSAITIDPKTQNIIVCGNDHKVSIF